MLTFIDSRRGRRQITTRSLMPRLAPTVLAIALAVLLGHVSAARVDGAPPPTHEDLAAQLGDLQTTVNSIGPWSQTLPAADRFVVVMGGAAVLDKETGLVWDQAPDATRRAWAASSTFCNQRTLGNRRGWRLPTVQELASLMDPTASSFPKLPSGHPFGNAVQADAYWSATAHDLELNAAWFVHFGNASLDVFVVVKAYDQLFAWCVRGGRGATDAQ